MLIDISNFVNEYNIGQKSSSSVQSTIQSFVKKYEPMFIREVLGKDYDYTTADTYSIKTNVVFLEALTAYVFYWYTRNNYLQSVGIGVTKPQSENSEVVKPYQKMVFAWNDMIRNLDVFIDEIGDTSIKNPYEKENQLEF